MGSIFSLLLTVTPILVILCLLIFFKRPADISGITGWVVISLIAIFAFDTSLKVVGYSTIAGVVRSFPVSLIVLTSLLQMAYMEKTGALRRVIIFIKTIASENKAVQIMMINIGFGILMVSVGATPVSLLPPILVAMGYSTYVAIALPAIGYDALCTYALLGAPIVAFLDFANRFFGAGNEISPSDAGRIFFLFLPIVSTLIAVCMLWIVGRWKAIKEGLLPVAVTGIVITVVSYFTNRVDNLVALTGVLCGLAVIMAMILYLVFTGKKVIDKSRLTDEERAYEKEYPLLKALSPWILLIVVILALNLPKGIYNYLYKVLLMPIYGITADGKPIITRALWNAYTWIFVSILLSFPILRPTMKQLKETVQVWWKRAPRPVFSAAIFFVIGEIMVMSGYNMQTKSFIQGKNMVGILAHSSAELFKGAYGAVVSFVGLLGGFITGSEASTVAMFSSYAMKTASQLGLDTRGILIIAASLAFGGGLASVISPAKLQNAASSIDKLGEENKVIKVAFVFSLILTLITSIFTLFLLYMFK